MVDRLYGIAGGIQAIETAYPGVVAMVVGADENLHPLLGQVVRPGIDVGRLVTDEAKMVQSLRAVRTVLCVGAAYFPQGNG